MILFHKVECYPIIINKMDGTEGCFVTWNKSDAGRNMAFCLLCQY
jgi:hypothetical protein